MNRHNYSVDAFQNETWSTDRVKELTMSRITSTDSTRTRSPFRVRVVQWAAPVAVCLVIAVALSLPRMLDREQSGDVAPEPGKVGESVTPDFDGHGALSPATLGGIKGLPTGDYTWDDGSDSRNYDRMATYELRLLMRTFGDDDASVMASFAVVRVASVQSFEEDGRRSGSGQIANCSVLYDVLGDGVDMPLHVRQYLYGGCTSDEETNLLRVGGVYVLPLVKFSEEETWVIYGDLDCLFEVDDTGMIHSHSQWDGLSKYDGKPLATLWSDIEYLSDNPILYSHFAENIGYGFVVETAGDTVKLVQPVVGWDDSDANAFSAKIGTNGKIVIGTDGFNVFRPFEGLTLEDVNAAITQIEEYIGA